MLTALCAWWPGRTPVCCGAVVLGSALALPAASSASCGLLIRWLLVLLLQGATELRPVRVLVLLACWLACNGLWMFPLSCLVLQRSLLLLLLLPSETILDLRLLRPRVACVCTIPLFGALLLL